MQLVCPQHLLFYFVIFNYVILILYAIQWCGIWHMEYMVYVVYLACIKGWHILSSYWKSDD